MADLEKAVQDPRQTSTTTSPNKKAHLKSVLSNTLVLSIFLINWHFAYIMSLVAAGKLLDIRFEWDSFDQSSALLIFGGVQLFSLVLGLVTSIVLLFVKIQVRHSLTIILMILFGLELAGFTGIWIYFGRQYHVALDWDLMNRRSAYYIMGLVLAYAAVWAVLSFATLMPTEVFTRRLGEWLDRRASYAVGGQDCVIIAELAPASNARSAMK